MNSAGLEASNLQQAIRDDLPTLSKAFRKVATVLVERPEYFIRSPIRELAEAIGVSEPTLIRFSRHYGYAGIPDFRLAVAMSLAYLNPSSNTPEPSLTDKEVLNINEKKAIARAARALVEDDKAIALDSGSTLQLFAGGLLEAPAKTIMTTSLKIVDLLKESRQHTLILTGGTLRPDAMSVTGRLTESAFAGLTFDTAYLGADNIDSALGVSTFSEEEAHVNRAMIAASSRVVILADSSKFRTSALHLICGPSKIDAIVTDTGLPVAMRRSIEAKGINLILATTPAS